MKSNVSEPKSVRNNSFLSNINWKNFVAGTAGGVISTGIFHPLELIKIRWQVYEEASLFRFRQSQLKTSPNAAIPIYRPKYRSYIDTLSNIYRSENGVFGLYRGIGINVIASGTAWGLYFLIYNGLKNRHENQENLTNKTSNAKDINLLNYTIDATLSGVITLCFTNPLFLLKTRMCLQYNSPNDSTKLVKYKNTKEALNNLIKTDGFLGLYKGIVPGLFGTLNGTIQMVCYDSMKSIWLRHLEKEAAANQQPAPQLESFHFSTFSAISKILAVVCTYPFQLVKARLQDQHQNYKSVSDVISKTYKHERFYGFYKGLLPALIRVTPAASVTFVVYENVLKFLA